MLCIPHRRRRRRLPPRRIGFSPPLILIVPTPIHLVVLVLDVLGEALAPLRGRWVAEPELPDSPPKPASRDNPLGCRSSSSSTFLFVMLIAASSSSSSSSSSFARGFEDDDGRPPPSALPPRRRLTRDTAVTIGYNLDSKKIGRKGIIKVADVEFDEATLNRIATISAGFEKGDFLVREEKGQRVYFDFFEEAFNYIAYKGYIHMPREEEAKWMDTMNNFHASVKGGMKYNTGKLLMVLYRPIEMEKE